MLWVLLPLQEVPAITQLPIWALEPLCQCLCTRSSHISVGSGWVRRHLCWTCSPPVLCLTGAPLACLLAVGKCSLSEEPREWPVADSSCVLVTRLAFPSELPPSALEVGFMLARLPAGPEGAIPSLSMCS